MTFKLFIPFISVFLLCNAVNASSDSTYYLTIGKSKLPLRFRQELDSTWEIVGKVMNATDEMKQRLKEKPYTEPIYKFGGAIDTILQMNPITLELEVILVKYKIVNEKYLVEKPNGEKMRVLVGKTRVQDTVMRIDPLTLGERIVVTPYRKIRLSNDLGDINFTTFINQIKSGLVIQNREQQLHCSELSLQYSTADTTEWLTIKYPNPDNSAIQKLSALKKGGFVILYEITTREDFVTEPVRLSTYFSVNKPSARPEKSTIIFPTNRMDVTKPIKDSIVNFSCAPSAGNIIYLGIDNPITVSVSGIAATNIRAIADEEYVTVVQKVGEPNTFIVHVNASGFVYQCVIHFIGYVNGNSIELGSQIFKIKRTPDPMITIDGCFRSGRSISAEMFPQFMGLVPLVEGFDLPVRYNVIEFDMVYLSKGKIVTSHANGPLFNAEMLEWMSLPKDGDVFFIESIKILGPDSMPRYLPAMSLMVGGD